MHLIRLHEIVKRYDGILALDHVNLNVNRGDILAVLGPNGAGKTTLLKIMAGIEKPTDGEIYYKGRRMNDYYSVFIRQRCTMVFQKTTVFNTNVYKNVAYGLKIRGLPKDKIDAKVHEALKLVKLEGYEKRLAKRLSGGEQQRISLARALVLEPEILLLDEPTANLDPKTTSIIEEVIRHINKESETTIVIATHNIFQVGNIARNIALMLNGKIGEIGTVEEIFYRPSARLASFARLENVFFGTAKTSSDGTSVIDVGDGVHIEAAFSKEGRVAVFIRPEDIIVSMNPLKSSARNVFKGKVMEVLDLGSVVKMKIDVGKVFTVQITKRSFKEMDLNIGSSVFIAYKASSVSLV
ncbi:TPA: ABC transporter ATP-binding protein [Candidatus Bathyarchaeota archaeon]|nr:ABC transporter ATP-binding protein [Candidatus Bathyarchaeota archaeon]